MAGDQDRVAEVRAGMRCCDVQAEDLQSTDFEAEELH